MPARETKSNGREQLERLGGSVAGGMAPRLVCRVALISLEGDGSGQIGARAEGVREYLADLGDAEQERTATLRRVNTRAQSMGEAKGAALLILTRHQLGKGFRVWLSAPRPRAVQRWETGDRFPVFSRFRRLPGLFPLAADLPKLGKVVAKGENVPGAYLEQLGAATLNRVRSSSPKWRGAAGHKRRKAKLKGEARKLSAYLLNLPGLLRAKRAKTADAPPRKAPTKKGYRSNLPQVRSIVGKGGVEGRVSSYLVGVYIARYMQGWRTLALLYAHMRAVLSALAQVDSYAFHTALCHLWEAHAGRESYAGYIGHSQSREHAQHVTKVNAELGKPQNAQYPPRSPDLLPLPPSAPLAPPA